MKGTEKQIAWAEEIVSNIEATMSTMIDISKANGQDTSNAEALTVKMMGNLNNAYAGNIINDFKDYKLRKIEDQEAKFAEYHFISDEKRESSKERIMSSIKAENTKIAMKNYSLINEALANANKAGRNYLA